MKIDSKASTVEDDAVFPILLRYLYSGEDLSKIQNELSNLNIFSLLSLSHSFGATRLIDYLQNHIVGQFLISDNAVRYYFESLMVKLELYI